LDDTDVKMNGDAGGSDDEVKDTDIPTSQDVPMDVDDVLMPSLSEVQQLMSSLEKQEQLQQLQDCLPPLPVEAPPPPPPIIIPEPKILDKDECRLNLLQHIEAVQTEFENRLEVMERALAEVDEASDPKLNGMSTSGPHVGLNDPVGHTKVLLSLLLQDLSTSKHLVHSK